MARPTKLTPELIEKAKTYLPACRDVVQYTDKGALTFVNVELPTIVGLALYLGINKDTVNEWCKDTVSDFDGVGEKEDGTMIALTNLRQEFSVLVKDILYEQEKRLLNNGLGGLYNPKLASLVLGRYGYVEKTETDVTSKGEQITSTILPEVIAEADRLLKERKLQ